MPSAAAQGTAYNGSTYGFVENGTTLVLNNYNLTCNEANGNGNTTIRVKQLPRNTFTVTGSNSVFTSPCRFAIGAGGCNNNTLNVFNGATANSQALVYQGNGELQRQFHLRQRHRLNAHGQRVGGQSRRGSLFRDQWRHDKLPRFQSPTRMLR